MLSCAKCGIDYGKFINNVRTNDEWWCERCVNPSPTLYKDKMEEIIGQTFGGTKTGHKALEQHRKNRAETEKSIGWDGSTTRDQRRNKKK